MTTVVLKIPDKKENYFLSLFKKHRLKTRVLEREEDEDLIAQWIDEGMKSEDVSEEEIFEIFRKNGIKV
ncbi:MAG: hypothetical protein FVQ77_05615 [Cytophagales bacterium]|nr:hypothetical protein [Cytophagales bacterium]